MVDENPHSKHNIPKYIKKLVVDQHFQEYGRMYSIKVLKEQDRTRYVIIIKPDFEAWLVKAAKDSGISLSDYGLPEDPRKLHKIINANLEKLDALLDEMIDRNSRYLFALREILRDIFKQIQRDN